jgi:hypothetical protein
VETAGFRNVEVGTALKRLKLPGPKDFLWQYIESTPIAEMVMNADKDSRGAFEREVTDLWKQFSTNGAMRLEVRITTAMGRA